MHQHRIIIPPLEACLDNSGKQEPYKHLLSSPAVANRGLLLHGLTFSWQFGFHPAVPVGKLVLKRSEQDPRRAPKPPGGTSMEGGQLSATSPHADLDKQVLRLREIQGNMEINDRTLQ